MLVTGAAGTLGWAIANAVVREGGIAFRTDLRGVVGEDIDQLHDVTKEEDWRKVIETIDDRFGRLAIRPRMTRRR